MSAEPSILSGYLTLRGIAKERLNCILDSHGIELSDQAYADIVSEFEEALGPADLLAETRALRLQRVAV